MTTATSTYRRDLMLACGGRHVPGDRIGEIVAEVESHVADTGEDPVAAFGLPKEYAASVAPAPHGARAVFWALTLSGAAVGWLIATSVVDLVRGDASVLIVLGALVWLVAALVG
jgi:hypothetical protein